MALGAAMDAARQPESVRDLSLCAWLLKDLGWVLLCAPLTFPAALVAILAEVWCLTTSCRKVSTGTLVHDVAKLLWLLGNTAWVAVDLLYAQNRAVALPWHGGSLLAADEGWYQAGSRVATCLWLAGLVLLLVYYAAAAVKIYRAVEGTPPSTERAAFGVLPLALYTDLFIGPWIMKDLFWNWENAIATQVCGAIVLLLVLDYARRTHSLHFVAEALWVCGNICWAWTELIVQEGGPLRFVASGCLTGGLVVLLVASAPRLLHREDAECKPLVDKPAMERADSMEQAAVY